MGRGGRRGVWRFVGLGGRCRRWSEAVRAMGGGGWQGVEVCRVSVAATVGCRGGGRGGGWAACLIKMKGGTLTRSPQRPRRPHCCYAPLFFVMILLLSWCPFLSPYRWHGHPTSREKIYAVGWEFMSAYYFSPFDLSIYSLYISFTIWKLYCGNTRLFRVVHYQHSFHLCLSG